MQNGNTKEFGMAAELWCHTEENCEVEGLEPHQFSPGKEHRHCFG